MKLNIHVALARGGSVGETSTITGVIHRASPFLQSSDRPSYSSRACPRMHVMMQKLGELVASSRTRDGGIESAGPMEQSSSANYFGMW